MTITLSLLISMILSLCFGFILLPVLYKMKAGQTVLSYVTLHKNKSGTATMGGIMFIFGIFLSFFVVLGGYSRIGMLALLIMLGSGILGFLDDYIKIKYKRNLGLKAYQKIIGQLSMAVLLGVFLFVNKNTEIIIPFTSISVDVGFFIIPLTVFVYVATVNGANLTDGQDGLCSVVSIIVLAALGVILYFMKEHCNLIGDTATLDTLNSLMILSFVSCGAIFAFLLFNIYPAKVFMGDTGSLALGGLITSIAVLSSNMLLIPLLCVMFVVSCVSVILQVIYFKFTKGKRIFLMAPFHHHLQQKGWHENKVVALYSGITILISLLLIIFTIYRFS